VAGRNRARTESALRREHFLLDAMIFFAVGTQRRPFDRLVVAADRLAASRNEAVIVQSGTSRSDVQHAHCLDFLPFADFDEHVRSARVVVTHAGIGSVALCLRHNKRPIVVPRMRSLGETIDDHQLEFARRLAKLDLVEQVGDIDDLVAAVAAPRAAVRRTGLRAELMNELIAYMSRYAAPRLEVADPSATKPEADSATVARFGV
jgi:UDP-N-acetylglucosamine transferase subunit ALG13